MRGRHPALLPQVGCWDGSVAVWRIPPEQPGSGSARSSSSSPALELQLLSHVMADTVAIRSVAWAPAQATGESSDLAGRHIFLTAGHSSLVKFWDARYAQPSWRKHRTPRSQHLQVLQMLASGASMQCLRPDSSPYPRKGSPSPAAPCRDPFQPLFEVPAQISWILSACWVHHPSGVLLCQEDGAFRWLSLKPHDRPVHEQKIQTTWW